MADHQTRARRFLERTPIAAFLVDSSAMLLDANQRARDLLGLASTVSAGATTLDVIHPDDVEEAARRLAATATLAPPQTERMRLRARHSDGRWVTVDAVAVNLLDEPGFGGVLISLRPADASDLADPRRRGWFEAVVSGTDDLVHVLDEDGRILWASGPVQDMIGVAADTIVGLRIEQLRHETEPAAAAGWFRAMVRASAARPITTRARRNINGRTVDLELRICNLLDDPEVEAVVMTTHDITRQVADEEARRFAGELLERAPVAFVATDPDGVVTMCNAEVARITGWGAADLVGRRLVEAAGHTAASLDAMHDGAATVAAGGTYEGEVEIFDRDGVAVPLYLAVTGLLDDAGTLTGIMAFGLDLRHETQVRKALASTEEHWASITRHAHELVALVDADGFVSWAGHGFSTLLGIEPESLLGTSIRDLVHPDDRLRPGGLADLAGDDRDRFGREYRLRATDGGWRVFDVYVKDLRGEASVGAFLITGRDVTDRVAAEDANRRLATAVESAGAVVVTTDTEGRILSWNREAERLTGQRAADVIGRHAGRARPVPDDRRREFRELLMAGATITFEDDQLELEGRRTTMSVTASPITDAVGTITGFSFIGFDVTEQREAAREREARANQARALAELGQRALSGASVPEVLADACQLAAATMRIDHVQVVLLDDHEHGNSGSFARLAAAAGGLADHAGTPLGTQVRIDLAGWRSPPGDDRRAVGVADLGAPGAPSSPLPDVELSVRSGVLNAIDGRDGPTGYLVSLHGKPRTYADGELSFLQSIANVLATAIERAQVTEEMHRQALHDELTGLPNRTLLIDRLTQAVNRLRDRHDAQVGLLFIDLDRFKRVNDTLGHRAGDEVLVATAARLLEAVRTGDTVARTGGDEFLVLTEDLLDPLGAVALADRIAAAVAEPVLVDGHGLHVTASIGVAIATDATTDPEDLVRDADLAMYRAKQDGRDRIQLFDGSMRDEAMSGMAMEEALRAAVAARAVRVVFQPQVRMVDGSLQGIEALARWDHPQLGEVPPSQFVAVAEDIGILDEITRIVLSATCDAAAALRVDEPELSAAVNLTPRQLGRRHILALVDDCLTASGLPAEALVVEVTETAALDDPVSLKILGELRDMGVRVSIDDFGTGYSSLARVAHLPVDEVKIDRSFVSGVADDRGCAAAVSAIVTLAKVLGLRLVAEGVEAPHQQQALVQLGCEDGQGWLFSSPLDRDALSAWAAARRDGGPTQAPG